MTNVAFDTIALTGCARLVCRIRARNDVPLLLGFWASLGSSGRGFVVFDDEKLLGGGLLLAFVC